MGSGEASPPRAERLALTAIAAFSCTPLFIKKKKKKKKKESREIEQVSLVNSLA